MNPIFSKLPFLLETNLVAKDCDDYRNIVGTIKWPTFELDPLPEISPFLSAWINWGLLEGQSSAGRSGRMEFVSRFPYNNVQMMWRKRRRRRRKRKRSGGMGKRGQRWRIEKKQKILEHESRLTAQVINRSNASDLLRSINPAPVSASASAAAAASALMSATERCLMLHAESLAWSRATCHWPACLPCVSSPRYRCPFECTNRYYAGHRSYTVCTTSYSNVGTNCTAAGKEYSSELNRIRY